MSEEVATKVRSLVAVILELAPEEVGLEADLVNELGADSMTGLELMATLEKEFSIVIPPEAMPELQSVASTANLVGRILGEGP